MLLVERSWEVGYRFGFGGQESDFEINGLGSLYTATFWEYDSKLGRRWNVDPIIKPSISGYSVFGNSPINYNDPFGLCEDCPEPPTGNGKQGERRTTSKTTTKLEGGGDGPCVLITETTTKEWYYFSGKSNSGVSTGWKSKEEYYALLYRQVSGEDLFNSNTAFDEAFAGQLHGIEEYFNFQQASKSFIPGSGRLETTSIEYDIIEFIGTGGSSAPIRYGIREGAEKLAKKTLVETAQIVAKGWSKSALKQADYFIYLGYKDGLLYIGKTFGDLTNRYSRTVIDNMNAKAIQGLTKIPNNGTALGVEYQIYLLNGGKGALANKINPTNNVLYQNAGKQWLDKNVQDWQTLYKYQ